VFERPWLWFGLAILVAIAGYVAWMIWQERRRAE